MSQKPIYKIKELMFMNGISEEKFITDLNLTPEMFKAWENGMTIPEEDLARIARYLNVTYDYFFLDVEILPSKGGKHSTSSSNVKNNEVPNEHRSFLSSLFNFTPIKKDSDTKVSKKASIIVSSIFLIISLALLLYFSLTLTSEGVNYNLYFFLIILFLVLFLISATSLFKAIKRK